MLLEGILKEEEEHVDWLEAQLGIMKEIGAENYLSRQLEYCSVGQAVTGYHSSVIGE